MTAPPAEPAISTGPVQRKYVSGETLFFRGEEFTLRVTEYPGKRTKITIKDNDLLVYFNRDLPAAVRGREIRARLEEWYRRMARETFTEASDYYKTFIGVEYNTLRVKNHKSRWGSCSARGNLNFNWRLVMAPIPVIDYVVVHELCHLVHMNHSKDFWRLVESHMPNYRERKRWLKEKGSLLRL